MRALASFTILTLVGVSACGGDDSGPTRLDVPDQCNPLGGSHCMEPWPSSVGGP